MSEEDETKVLAAEQVELDNCWERIACEVVSMWLFNY